MGINLRELTPSQRKYRVHIAWWLEYRAALRERPSLRWYKDVCNPTVQPNNDWFGSGKWWWKAKTGQLLAPRTKRDHPFCPACGKVWAVIATNKENTISELAEDLTTSHILWQCQEAHFVDTGNQDWPRARIFSPHCPVTPVEASPTGQFATLWMLSVQRTPAERKRKGKYVKECCKRFKLNSLAAPEIYFLADGSSITLAQWRREAEEEGWIFPNEAPTEDDLNLLLEYRINRGEEDNRILPGSGSDDEDDLPLAQLRARIIRELDEED